MKTLIVYAHQEKNSFNSALKEKSVSVLRQMNHEIVISDLYAMNFKAVADREDFRGIGQPDHINYLMEQKKATAAGTLSPDILAEQNKIQWADLIIFHCPVWWFSVPAILKGWFDRVLTAGFAWDFGKIYNKGLLVGKKAMLVVTTGGPAESYSAQGPHGVDIQQVLYTVNHGTLYFCGMAVLPPFVAFSVLQTGDDGRKKYLTQYEERLNNLSSLPAIEYARMPQQ
jgi:NAD(P)H dehydrogenase (quinone)